MEWLNYQFASRMSAAVGAGFGYDDVGRGSDMFNEQLQARFNARVAQKLNLSLNGGMQVRQFVTGGDGSIISPIFGASVQYRPFDYTTLSLSANRSLSPSLLTGQLNESTDISLGLNQRLLGLLYLTLSGGFGNSSYLAANSAAQESRSDDTMTFSASLSYRFWTRASASISYQFNENNSSQRDFGYDSSQIGFNLAYRF